MKKQRFHALSGPHERIQPPKGHRIYAIGDIHGRHDLLTELLDIINEDIAVHSETRNTCVFLGDYIDRGPESAGVIEHLSSLSISGADCIFLMGNHEKYLLDLLVFGASTHSWFQNGGRATVKSYGIAIDGNKRPSDSDNFHAALKKAIPAKHLKFLGGLKTSWQLGNLFFAHAGVNPARPIDEQRDEDLIWIREKFLNHEKDHGALIIHGHTPRNEPEVLRNRINIDTGAWQSNYLTAVALENGHCRFLST